MRSIFVRMAALCLLLVLGNGSAQAQRGLLFKDEKGTTVYAPVLGTTVEVRVTGIIARARVTQIFKNPSSEWIEGVYIFPLPEGAAVDTLKMKVGDRTLAGVIRDKQEAVQEYIEAMEEGKKASLVEQRRPDVFTTSVANIGPGETVEIAIELQDVVRWEMGRFRLRFPMVVAPRYSPSETPDVTPPLLPLGSSARLASRLASITPFAFHVDLAAGFPLGRLESPSHEIAIEEGARHRYAVDLAKGVEPADRDFILEWTPAVGREPRAVFYSEEVDGERYDLLMVMPPDDPAAVGTRLPREAVFIIDTSGSMNGDSIEQARQALLLALGRLQPGDWFNVVQFNSEAEALFPDSVPVDPGSVETARRYVSGLKADGGTEILKAVQLVLGKKSERAGLVRQMVFVTDGQVGNEKEIYSYLGQELGERRLFTVAIGSAPNVSFLRKSAELGRGTFVHVSQVSEVAERMGALFAQLEAPMLRDLEVHWDDPAAEVWPARIPDLYLGEPLVVTARRGTGAGTASVSGQRGGELWQDSFPAAAEIRGAGIHKLWAQRKITSLLDSLRLQSGAGGNVEEVRRAVIELGMRHHLVTTYTSLVAVDVTPTAPAGVRPARRTVPLTPPRGFEAVEFDGTKDVITVCAESPLLDSRRITTGSTVTQTPLETLPGASDPWAVLGSTPGVLTDRVNVGGNESGRASFAVGQGAAADQNVWQIDGLVITDLSSLGSSPAYYDFDSFEEMQVMTGGPDVALETPGAHVNMITKRGTNEWSGAGRFLSGDTVRSGDAGLGGPLQRDRFWIWGSLHRAEIDRDVLGGLGGQREESLHEGGTLKLNAQLAPENSAIVFWNQGETSVLGWGASPSRAPETTWDRDGREEIRKVEDTHIFGANFYLTGLLASADRTLRDVPLGGLGGEARIDAAGVAHEAWFGLEEDSRTRTGDLRTAFFFNTGSISHDWRTGIFWRGEDREALFTAPGRIEVAEETLVPGNARVVEIWRGGTVRTETTVASAWFQDTANVGYATLFLGLRFDQQDLGIPGGARPYTLAPRLGVNYSFGPERKTLLKASLSRFASRLGAGPASRLDPNTPATSYFFSTVEGDQPWYSANLDPLLGVNPNAVDPDLAPEITDELALGVEHALLPEFVIGLQGTWRRTEDVLEERLLVRDENGTVFTATAADWIPLTDGVFDLRPGLTWTGGTLLTNGDRGQDYLGFSLFWNKRLANRWMSSGHVTWSDWTWRVGPGFERYDDPTRALGGGDRDGDPVAVPASAIDWPYAADRFIASRWSFHWDGLYQFFPDRPAGFNVALAVNGREGYPAAFYRQVVRERAGIARVPVADFGSSRTEDVLTVDARLEKEVAFNDFGLAFGLDVFNLLNEDTALWCETDLGTSRAGLANDAIDSRTYRLGLRVSWR